MRVCCWLLLILPLLVFGQERFEFNRLGVNEGLSQNSVYAIHQDNQGFLWIGTGDGLNRFDGKKFKIYRQKFGDTSSNSLPGRIITGGFVEDDESQLWFTMLNGLVVFDKTTEEFRRPLRNSFQKDFQKQVRLIGFTAGKIWCYAKNEILEIDPQSYSLRRFKLGSPVHEAVLVEGEIFYTTKEGFYSFNIFNQTVALRLHSTGLEKLVKLSPKKFFLKRREESFFFDVAANRLRPFKIANEAGGRQTDVLIEYPENVFYLRDFSKGLIKYDANTSQTFSFSHSAANSSSLSNDFILVSYLDRSKNLWVGTEGGGLSFLDLKSQKFRSFPSQTLNQQQAANLMVKSIFSAGSKTAIGTFAQGLYIIDTSGAPFERRRFTELEKITAPASTNIFYRDSKGRVWMNVGHAIGIIDTASFQFQSHTLLQPLPGQVQDNFSVYSFIEIGADEFLAGSNYGLHRVGVVNGKPFSYVSVEDRAFRGHIQHMQQHPDGTIYFGKIGDGLTRVRAVNGKLKYVDKQFQSTGIRHMYFSKSRPIIWLASENGLIAYHTTKKLFSVFDEKDGLSNSYVYSILQQSDSVLWISTNRGLNKVFVSYRDVLPKIKSVNIYTQVHGLQSNEFNTGAFHQDRSGRLFFGGVNGINWFYPQQVVGNHFKPQLSFTRLLVNEKPFSSDTALNYLHSLNLLYNQNTISIQFASLEFTNASANAYAYQLLGIDNDWIYSGNNNEARYANLPPGNYVFQLKGSNSDGIWTDDPISININIEPPYWATAWFKLLLIILILLAAGSGIRFYISLKVRNKVKELEKQKAVDEERLRISKDMHDELGTGLTKIALLSEVTKQRLHNTSSVLMLPLEEITSTSRQLTQKMGEIIWTLNPINDTLDNLAAYLKEQLYDICESANLDLKFRFPATVPEIKMSNLQRQQVLLVTKEGMHNILKHSEASSVIFSLQVLPEEIVFTLSDNGKGFDYQNLFPSVTGKKNGLANMAWRMEQAGGSFELDSEAGTGTRLRYSVRL